jgi:hypothetical protein
LGQPFQGDAKDFKDRVELTDQIPLDLSLTSRP